MIFTIFLIILTIPKTCTIEMVPFSLFSQIITQNYQNFIGFTVDEMNFSGDQKVLVFGGNLNGILQNQILQTRLHNGTTAIETINGAKPPPRYNHCSLIIEYKMYIYGGIDQHQNILTDFWEFNSIFSTWSLLGTSNSALKSCNIIKNGTKLIIAGSNITSDNLQMVQYSLLNNQWSALQYRYGQYLIQQGKTWYNETLKTKISIQTINIQQSLPSPNIQYVNSLWSPTIKLQPYNSTNYLVITDWTILILDLVTMHIHLLMDLKWSTYEYLTTITNQWLFVIKMSENSVILVEHYLLTDFKVSGILRYETPSNENNFQIFMVNNDIYLVAGTTMNSYIIQQNCNTLAANLPTTGVQLCFYNKVVCQQGYVGDRCQISSCTNTLLLFDTTSYETILNVCSGHGVCSSNGCQCEQYWTGDDCSIYTRTNCQGQLINNWPVMNCQCENETVGGNSCQVVFCYNDCSDNGECLPSGICVCDTGYYGTDCSITIIEFPGSTFSI